MTPRHRGLRSTAPRRIAAVLVSLAQATIAVPTVGPGRSFATANTSCNAGQVPGDNTWVVRSQQITPSASAANSYVSLFDYSLCTVDAFDEPWQSGSGAWAGLINTADSGDIIQVGYWKCGTDQAVGCGNYQADQLGILMTFWAWGDGSIWHMPWPHPLATIPVEEGAGHQFEVYKVDRTTCYWSMSVDPGTPVFHYATVPCSSIPWTPTYVQIGNEVWNSGDQLGGWSGSPQAYWDEWGESSQGVFTDVDSAIRQSGHCLPQADFAANDPSWADWGSWTWVAAHDPC